MTTRRNFLKGAAESARGPAHGAAGLPLFSTTGITTVCDKCSAAMVLIGVWPISAEDLEVRMFRCEICANSVFYKKVIPNSSRSPPPINLNRACLNF
jgi:hypothetical protein